MRNSILKYLLLELLLMGFCPSSAQEKSDEEKPNQLTVDAQLMSRGEVKEGGLPTSSEAKDEENRSAYVFNRARLSVGFEREKLSLKITARHQGVWGAEGGGTFNISEAWAQMKSNNGLFARIGRQELAYDDERILGSNDWAMAALYHDALKVGYEGKGHQLHGMLAYNQNSKNINGGTFYQNGSQPYKTMHTAWYHYDFPKIPLGVSLILMNIGMQYGNPDDHTTLYQQLVGGYAKYHPRKLTVEAAYYHQMGKASIDYSSIKSIPIDAWMASFKTTYNISRQLTGYAGFDYLSGDKEFVVPKHGNLGLTQHTKITAFTSIFGSTHKFYGAMDFFYVSAYFGTFSPGLQNVFAGASYAPFKGFSCNASYHYLATATHLKNLDWTLGHEIELGASYQVMKDTRLSMGFSFMKGTETMEALKRSTDRHKLVWGWLMLNISPRVFYSKW